MSRTLFHETPQIVDIQFKQIQQRLEEAGIRLEATEEVLDYLGDAGFDPQFGARPLKRVLQRQILNELSKEIHDYRRKGDANRPHPISSVAMRPSPISVNGLRYHQTREGPVR